MKRLITLLALLLAGPPLASAQTIATSGGMSLDASSTTSSFEVFGPDFSMFGDIFGNPLNKGGGLVEGTGFDFSIQADSFNNLEDISVNAFGTDLTVTFAGVWFFSFLDSISVPGPGTYTTPFLFHSDVGAVEGELSFDGAGIIRYQVVPTDTPGVVNIVSANYIIPEPSTASLLLLGLAGFGVMGRRRRPRVTLLASG